jgi:hypothetical protein
VGEAASLSTPTTSSPVQGEEMVQRTRWQRREENKTLHTCGSSIALWEMR